MANSFYFSFIHDECARIIKLRFAKCVFCLNIYFYVSRVFFIIPIILQNR